MSAPVLPPHARIADDPAAGALALGNAAEALAAARDAAAALRFAAIVGWGCPSLGPGDLRRAPDGRAAIARPAFAPAADPAASRAAFASLLAELAGAHPPSPAADAKARAARDAIAAPDARADAWDRAIALLGEAIRLETGGAPSGDPRARRRTAAWAAAAIGVVGLFAWFAWELLRRAG